MIAKDVFDWLTNAAVGLGVPGAAWWYIRQRLAKSRAQRRAEAADAQVTEATAPDRVKSSSITTLDAQLAATISAFDAERAAKDRTIGFLTNENARLQEANDEKDRRLREALERIDQLQAQLNELAEQVRSAVAPIQDDLA